MRSPANPIKRKPVLQILLLAIGAFFMLNTISCKPKHPDNEQGYCTQTPGSCQSVLAAKEFFLFKEGSWWVYEEETSHVRDSMFVFEAYNYTNYGFDITIESALDGYQYSYWPTYIGNPTDNACSQTNPVHKICMIIKRSKGKSGDFVGEGKCFFLQYNLEDSIYSYNGNYFNNTVHIKDILSSYSIGGNIFGETVKVFDRHCQQEKDHPTYHYFSRGVGLVRKEYLDTAETWNLVNYHIEP